MPKIEVSIAVNKDKKDIFELIKHLEHFPIFVKDIKNIKVVERYPNRIITDWEANIDGARVIWREEDRFDNFNSTMYFTMLKGDFKGYKGKWVIAKHKKISKIYLLVDFDWGIPIFERFVGDILLRKARVYLKGMLKAIKKKIENEKLVNLLVLFIH